MKKIFILLCILYFPFNSAWADDRSDIITTIENFYIGDKTGSKLHREMSLHPVGAYRYVNKKGEFKESTFVIKEGGKDTSYDHELLNIDIFENVAIAKLRLENKTTAKPEYKVMLLNKSKLGWRITTISWGFSITQ